MSNVMKSKVQCPHSISRTCLAQEFGLVFRGLIDNLAHVLCKDLVRTITIATCPVGWESSHHCCQKLSFEVPVDLQAPLIHGMLRCLLSVKETVASAVSVDVGGVEVGHGPQAHAALEGGGRRGGGEIGFGQGLVAQVVVESCRDN